MAETNEEVLNLPPDKDPGQVVTDIINRRDESKKWLKYNVWDELTEVWRGIKMRTSPIYKRNAAGDETKSEDKSRTNVAMPDLNIIFRRNAARMTAQPYRLKYTGSGDPMVADSLSALAIKQYDRSNEKEQDVRLVLASEAFGYSYSKLYYDKLCRTMLFRKAVMMNGQVVMRDRASIMKAHGAGQDEVDGAVNELGPEMSDEEIADVIGKSGSDVMKVPTDVTKYEGPIVKWVFNGDLFLEPGAYTLDASEWLVEQYRETELWLKKMLSLVYTDDADGKQYRAFDVEAVKALINMDPALDARPDELRDLMMTVLGKQDQEQYKFPKHLRIRKKFDILEEHAPGPDGRMWITWVSENYKDKPLGRMPYPWDLYGQFCYQEYVPLPDLLTHIGDCTPRLLRYLYQMHNATVAQNFDYVSALLKKFLMVRRGVEISNNVTDRGWFRELEVPDLNAVQWLQEPQLPAGAFEREGQILRMMNLAEPSLGNTDSGSDVNPQAGKLATTALLASKAGDSLTQFKMDNRDTYLRKLGQKKLWMIQQVAEEPWEIESKYWNQGIKDAVEGMDPNAGQDKKPQWALSDRNGKTVSIRLDPMEIQEDIDVEPEAGSYLSIDDELRQAAAQKLEQAMAQAPGILDPRKVIRFHMTTIRGIGNPDDYFLPPAPPVPPIKGNISIQIKWPELPIEWQQAIAQDLGLPHSDELDHEKTLDGVNQLSEAADSATNLSAPANPGDSDLQPEADKEGVRKPGVPGFKS